MFCNHKYILHRRFRDNAICGEVNLPYGTECEYKDNILTVNDMSICVSASENAHQYFAINDDGKGLYRGKLTQAIQKCLSKRDDNYQNRWDKIWNSDRCQKYKRIEHADFWLWNHDFFNAPIEDLEYIANLIGIEVNKID